MRFRINKDKPHLGGNIVESPIGDPNTYYPDLWKWLVEHYAVKSVLDVGCGSGHSSVCFKDLGCYVVGIDGLEENIEETRAKGVVGILQDYEKGPSPLNESFDLCWTCEFVEHVEAKYVENFMQDMRRGRIIAMTHALPDQLGGHHHVNCQGSAYWEGILNRLGYRVDLDATRESRQYAGGFWSSSGMILTQGSCPRP